MINWFCQCPWCIKTFLNGDYLAGHLQRRHQKTFISSVGSKVKEEKATVQTTGGDELDELKTRLQAAENQLKQEQFLLHQIINKVCNGVRQRSLLPKEKINHKYILSNGFADGRFECLIARRRCSRSSGKFLLFENLI